MIHRRYFCVQSQLRNLLQSMDMAASSTRGRSKNTPRRFTTISLGYVLLALETVNQRNPEPQFYLENQRSCHCQLTFKSRLCNQHSKNMVGSIEEVTFLVRTIILFNFFQNMSKVCMYFGFYKRHCF